jgi:predicted TIM-barrel fold metal-dependent hydrolase
MLNVDTPRLLAFVKDWFPDTAMHQKLLVDNPAKLYGF